MVEGEQKLCLAEPTLELMENILLQIQMQLMEEMEALEVLAAEVEKEAKVEMVIIPLVKEQMEVSAELVVMGAEAEEGALAGEVRVVRQEQEIQQVLVALEAEAAAEGEGEGLLRVAHTIMVVMAQQEVMAEEEVEEEELAAVAI